MVLPPTPRAAQPLLLGARRKAAAVGTSLITDGGRHRRDDQEDDDEHQKRSGKDGAGARQLWGEQSFHPSILRRVESVHLSSWGAPGAPQAPRALGAPRRSRGAPRQRDLCTGPESNSSADGEFEERHGFAGVLRASGGLGGPWLGPPSRQSNRTSRAKTVKADRRVAASASRIWASPRPAPCSSSVSKKRV